MKRAGLYVRVSTEEQKRHGLSVDSQITALRNYCNENGITEVGLYNDAGISARKSYKKRPALLNMIEDCKQGKIDIILFTRLDRWFRSVQDYYEVQAQLDACNVPWRTIWEDYQVETSDGIFKTNLMLSIAQAEADRTSEKIKSVFEYKRSKGDYIGGAPLGYRKSKGQLLIDEEMRDGMNAFFQTYLSTFSLPLSKLAAEELGVHIDINHISKTMLNSAYYGITSTGYKCEPYITKAQHDIIENRVKTNRRERKNSNFYIFSGIVRCGCCGLRMSGVTKRQKSQKTGSTQEYVYYNCHRYGNRNYAHEFNSVREDFLEDYLLKYLDEMYLNHIQDVKVKNMSLENADTTKHQKQLEAKLKRLAVLFEDGDIELDAYREKRDVIKAELSQINVEPIVEPEPLPSNWKEIYSNLDQEHKAIFWKKIINYISVPVGANARPTIYFL